MPTDYEKEYDRYQERFRREVGPMKPGQYGRHKGRLVVHLSAGEFRAKVEEYMELGGRFNAMLQEGDTIDDTLATGLRTAEIELVLERSLFWPEALKRH